MIDAAPAVGVFLFLGSLFSLYLSVQDIRTLKINNSWNFMMLGMAILMLISFRLLLYQLAVIAMSMIFPWTTKKFFKSGDTTMMTWQIIGLGAIGPTFLGLYYIIFPLYLTIQTIAGYLLCRSVKMDWKTTVAAGIPILAGTFWTITAIYWIVFA